MNSVNNIHIPVIYKYSQQTLISVQQPVPDKISTCTDYIFFDQPWTLEQRNFSDRHHHHRYHASLLSSSSEQILCDWPNQNLIFVITVFRNVRDTDIAGLPHDDSFTVLTFSTWCRLSFTVMSLHLLIPSHPRAYV